MRSFGNYYSWSNKGRHGKRIWSRIDRGLTNLEWFQLFEFNQVECMAEGISDHTSLILSLPLCPQPPASFKYCDIWSKDPYFQTIVASVLSHQQKGSSIQQLIHVHRQLRKPLKQLNSNRYKDIYTQLETSKAQLEDTQNRLHQSPIDQQMCKHRQTKKESGTWTFLTQPLSSYTSKAKLSGSTRETNAQRSSLQK